MGLFLDGDSDTGCYQRRPGRRRIAGVQEGQTSSGPGRRPKDEMKIMLRNYVLRVGGVLRCLSSASGSNKPTTNNPLCIVGQRGTTITNVVLPDFDLKERLRQGKLRRSLLLRGQDEAYVDQRFELLKRGVDYIEYLTSERNKVAAIFEKRRALREKEGNGTLDEAEQAELAGLEKDLPVLGKQKRELNESLWDVEEMTIEDFLNLPNDLLPIIQEQQDVFRVGEMPKFNFSPKGHVDLAGEDLVYGRGSDEFAAPYLIGPLAELEMTLSKEIQRHLLSSGLFSMLAGPDLAKSVVVEGCGVDFADVSETLALEETGAFERRETGQAMHLVGNASLFSMVAFFCKNVVLNPSLLPMKVFCVGRQYRGPTSKEDGSKKGLFSTQQSTAAYFLDVTAYDAAHDLKRLENFVQLAKTFYETLGIPVRATVCSPRGLSKAEAHRVDIEAFSPAENDFVKVGNLSVYGDYLSKRMMLKAEKNDKELLNLRLIGGTFANITKLIGCLVECKQDDSGNYCSGLKRWLLSV